MRFTTSTSILRTDPHSHADSPPPRFIDSTSSAPEPRASARADVGTKQDLPRRHQSESPRTPIPVRRSLRADPVEREAIADVSNRGPCSGTPRRFSFAHTIERPCRPRRVTRQGGPCFPDRCSADALIGDCTPNCTRLINLVPENIDDLTISADVDLDVAGGPAALAVDTLTIVCPALVTATSSATILATGGCVQ